MPNHAYQVYRHSSVMTATPGELTLMLYDGCIKFIRRGREAIERKDYEQKNIFLQKAQAIINELMVTLNLEQPVSESMMRMYDYMHRRLVEANVKNDPKILDEVEGLVADFRDTWKRVIEITKKNQPKRDRV
ncbi:flagellar export chaperone FliS [Sporolactobacillus sp. THM7-7]|nr:flagellar export chaperone FliS [Sporolactobacillus sp. THM7-7]